MLHVWSEDQRHTGICHLHDNASLKALLASNHMITVYSMYTLSMICNAFTTSHLQDYHMIAGLWLATPINHIEIYLRIEMTVHIWSINKSDMAQTADNMLTTNKGWLRVPVSMHVHSRAFKEHTICYDPINFRKRFLKRNLADAGMAQWMHWLTKYTNKECHTVICTP